MGYISEDYILKAGVLEAGKMGDARIVMGRRLCGVFPVSTKHGTVNSGEPAAGSWAAWVTDAHGEQRLDPVV